METFLNYLDYLAKENMADYPQPDPIKSNTFLNRFDYDLEKHLRHEMAKKIYEKITLSQGLEKLYFLSELNRQLLMGYFESRASDPFTRLKEDTNRQVVCQWLSFFQQKIARSHQRYLHLLIDPYTVELD
jgi:hypothetical protein